MLAFQERLKCLDMSSKCSPSQVGDGIGGVGLAPDETFFAADVAQVFEAAGMAGQVAVGEFEQRFHGREVHRLVGHQHRHDAQANLALESLVQSVQVRNHGSVSPSIFHDEDDSENDVEHAKADEPRQ